MRIKYYLPLPIVFILIPHVVLSANHYVRSGATGNGTGMDWANAFPLLPTSLVRGDTYYIADGQYSSYTFDDATSGSLVITIIKATAGIHGTEAGWLGSYGDGQASWGPINFNSSYWVFDGQVGSGTGESQSYGFKVSYSGSGRIVKLIRFDNSPSYITVRHVDMAHAGAFGDNGHDIIYSFGATTIRFLIATCTTWGGPPSYSEARVTVFLSTVTLPETKAILMNTPKRSAPSRARIETFSAIAYSKTSRAPVASCSAVTAGKFTATLFFSRRGTPETNLATARSRRGVRQSITPPT